MQLYKKLYLKKSLICAHCQFLSPQSLEEVSLFKCPKFLMVIIIFFISSNINNNLA